MAVLLGVFAAIGFGVNDYLAGIAARRVSPVTITFWVHLIELPAFVVAAFVVADPLDAGGLAFGVLAGAAAATGLVLFYRALAIGRFSVVAAISGGITAALPAAVGFVQGDRIGPLSTAGVVAMAVGIVVVTAFEQPPDIPEIAREHARHRELHSWIAPDVALAIVAGVLFAGTFVWLDAARERTGQWSLVASSVVPFAALALVLWLRAGTSFRLGPSTRTVVAGASLNALGSLALVAAFGAGALGIASASASFYPVVTGVCAFVFLRERIRPVQAYGLGVAAGALVLLAIGEVA